MLDCDSAGPVGIFTHKEVFTSIYNTIKQFSADVMAYTTHVPSFADTWGWVMASNQPFLIGAEEMDKGIEGTIIIMCKFSLLNNKFVCRL
ncbi:thermospermine synthase ACAULIS5 [Senna tora]|uniref:Thermospermine synthase ACAULIS5 n=1 Tax=Senna tora TaxID=362788 RepID=A0A834W7N5_9FABA|nr:thermospermine synthase ACAULIS5 [Senna tora]